MAQARSNSSASGSEPEVCSSGTVPRSRGSSPTSASGCSSSWRSAMTGSVRRDLPDRRTVTVARSAGAFLVGGAFGGTTVSGAACRVDDVVEGVPGPLEIGDHPVDTGAFLGEVGDQARGGGRGGPAVLVAHAR